MKSKKAQSGQALRNIDVPIYRYYQALFLSYFSANLYVDIGKRWKGYGFAYLLFLVAVLAVPYSLRMAYDFSTFYQDEIIDPIQQLPKVYVQNGLVTFDKPMPYFIKNKAGKQVLAVDTTGELNGIDAQKPDLMMLIKRDEILFRLPVPNYFFDQTAHKKNSTVYSQHFDSRTNEVLTGASWIKSSSIYRIKWFAISLFYPLVVAAFYMILLVFYLIFSFLAQLIAKVLLRFSLDYKQTFRMLITASTPALTLFFLTLFVNYTPPLFGGFFFMLVFFYFGYGVFNLKRESSQLIRT